MSDKKSNQPTGTGSLTLFNKVLIANRGEIALRIIRACRELGIETVAIFSEADRGAHYLDLADEAFCVGGPRPADSYLRIANVISAAEVGNVQAIHPGYGFLAENAHFNEVCRSCKIDFIGPSPASPAPRAARWPTWPAALSSTSPGWHAPPTASVS